MEDADGCFKQKTCCKDYECYLNGPISVCFESMPKVQLVSISFDDENRWLQKLKTASSRREFSLTEDWELRICRVGDPEELNGTIIIPRTEKGETVMFDGASVPAPWTVTFISGGLLRPLGLMLIASIVHDFAFKYGYLHVRNDETGVLERLSVKRHEADLLFRNIIHTISEMPLIAEIAWIAVRMGWIFFVKYNGRMRGGQPPIKAVAIFALVLFITPVLLVIGFGGVAALAYFGLLLVLLLGLHIAIWVARSNS